jgi:hypothetical protein
MIDSEDAVIYFIAGFITASFLGLMITAIINFEDTDK